MVIGAKAIIKFLFGVVLVSLLLGCTLKLSVTDLVSQDKTASPVAAITGVVTDATFHVSLTQSPQLSWATPATSHPISHYEIALGSAAEASDVVGWLNIGAVTSYTFNGLTLTDGATYFPSVRALDSDGNIVALLSGDGWISVKPPNTITLVDDDIAHVSTTTTPILEWTYSGDLASTAAGFKYEVAIGSSAGTTNILTWTSAGLVTSWSSSGLSLSVGNTYYASVRIVDSNAHVYSVTQGDGWKIVPSVSVIARYSDGPNWNDYLKTASPTIECEGVDQGYHACIHGGEKRRVNYPAATNCGGYTVIDRLSAFEWTCDESGGIGNVYFYSRGLKKSKGLADLVNATSWKNNKVIIYSGGIPVAASAASAWWTNQVLPLPDSPIPGVEVNLLAGKIYTVSGIKAVSGGYMIGYEVTKVGVVTLPGARLIHAADADNTTTLIWGSVSSDFFWIEGEYESLASTFDYLFYSYGNHGVVRNLKSFGFYFGLGNGNSLAESSLFSRILVTHSRDVGLRIKGNYNLFEDINASNNVGSGIVLGDISSYNVLKNVVAANNGNIGVYLYSGSSNTLIGVTAINNISYGIFESSNTDSIFLNVFGKGNSASGLSAMSTTRSTYSQTLLYGIILNSVTTTKFTGNLLAVSCNVLAGTNPGLVNTTCANQGSSNAVRNSTNTIGTSSLVGQISMEDGVNASDTAGVKDFSSITDWIHFDNFWRAWGKQGTFPSGTAGACATGICNIWDFTLKPADTELRNSTGTALAGQNGAFTNGAACPAAVTGNAVSVSVSIPVRTFLTNAVEIAGMGGNENGLCESNEKCLYMPNFGAYQGAGDFWNNRCTFSNGTVTGVSIYAYPVN